MQTERNMQLQKKLVCYKCGKTFPSQEEIAVHLKLIHNACITPDCKNIADLNMHSLTCPYRRLNCVVCHKLFKDKSLFITHFNQHIDVALFVCEICREGFQLRKNLQKHVFEAHDTNTVLPDIPARSKAIYQKCPHCFKYFKLFSEFEEHKSSCNSESLICHLCQVSFPTLQSLENHSQIEHHTGRAIKGHKALIDGKRYFCGLCYLGFFTGSILQQHIKTHEVSANFKCDVCYSSFNSDDDLQEHYLLHIEEHYILHDVIKQHACGCCKSMFKSQQQLVNHFNLGVCTNKSVEDISACFSHISNPDMGNSELANNVSGSDTCADVDASDIPVYIYKSGDELLNCDDSNCVIVVDHKSVFVFQRGSCATEDRMPDLNNSEAYKEDDDIDASLLNNHMFQVLYPPTASNGENITSENVPTEEVHMEQKVNNVESLDVSEPVDNDMLQEIYEAVLRA